MINIKISSCTARIPTILFAEQDITKPMNNMNYRVQAVFSAMLLMTLGACEPADKKVPVFTATGVVTENGKPLDNATVVFHATNGAADVPKPSGKTNAQGEYKLTTYDTNDGAPAGDYAVTVEKWTTLRPDEGPANRLPAKYARPETSKLQLSIKAEQNQTLPTLELKK
jgi:hypothetical protein